MTRINYIKGLLFAALVFSSLWLNLFAQTKSNIDSLNQKANYYRDINIDSVLYYSNKALVVSETEKYIKGEIQSRINLCFACYVKGDSDLAIENCTKAISLKKKSNSQVEIHEAYLFLGLTKIGLGLNNEAINDFLPLVDLATKKNNDYLLSDACSNIGLAYLGEKNYLKARQFYNTAIKIHKNIDHPHGKVYVLQNMARIFFEQSQFDSAKFYLHKTIQIAEQINNERAKYYGYLILGQIPDEDWETQENYLKTALDLNMKLRIDDDLAYIYYLIAKGSLENNYISQSITYAQKSAELYKKKQNLEQLQKSYYILVKGYTLIEDYEKSEYYIQIYDQLQDSLSKTKTSYLNGLLNANELVEDERNYEIIKTQLKAAQLKIEKDNIVIIGSILTVVFIAILLFVLINTNRKQKKNNTELADLNEKLDLSMTEKDLLLGMIMHDLRSPLNKLTSLIDLFKNSKTLSKDQLDLIELMDRVIHDSRHLTEELLEINKLESNGTEINIREIKIIDFIEEIINHFDAQALSKSIKITKNFDLLENVLYSDNSMVRRILENIISNAIKFTPIGGQISINIGWQENHLTCSVKDNGPGIPKAEQKYLFKKFGKTSAKPTGNEISTGLGLYIVHTLINTLGGMIFCMSEPEQGTNFLIRIPSLELKNI